MAAHRHALAVRVRVARRRDRRSPLPGLPDLRDRRAADSRCSVCGSPRLLRHKERDTLAIAHVDCDAFFAAVEKRDNPSLADKPVIIGGGKRGVVSTCCYVARTYGVRSAMPMFKALEACPHAVVITPDMEKYRIAGREVRQLMLELTPLVEPVSIDEAFLDLSGTERLHHGSPAVTLARFARRVEEHVGITVSVGLSYNKFLAKIASDFEKPRGFADHRASGGRGFPGRQAGLDDPRHRRRRAGKAGQGRHHPHRPSAGRLAAGALRGARTRFAAAGEARLGSGRPPGHAGAGDQERFGGNHLRRGSARISTISSRFSGGSPRRSRAASRRADLAGQSITLKLKDSEFRLLTRTRSGLPPTQLAIRLFEPARHLLKAACDGTAFRLIGIGAADLCDAAEADRGDLADQTVVKQAHMESAIDKIRDKFGDRCPAEGHRPAQASALTGRRRAGSAGSGDRPSGRNRRNRAAARG